MKLQVCGEVDPRKVEVDPATDRRCVFLVNVIRFSWSLTRRCPQEPQSCVLVAKYDGKSPSAPRTPHFVALCAGRKTVAWGVGPPCSGHLRGQTRRFGSQKRSFRRKKTLICTKTVSSTDRLVALPGRSNLTPRLRSQVDLRGAGGGSKNVTVPVRNRRF